MFYSQMQQGTNKALKDRPEFDYGDIFDAQTMLRRLGNVALVTTFNDACGAINGAMPKLEKIADRCSDPSARGHG